MTQPNAETEPLLRQQIGSTEVLTLHRPQALNSVNGALTRALDAAITDAESDPEVRVIVLTGEGRAFCAGLDLKAAAAGPEAIAEVRHPVHGFAALASRVTVKPLIAAVNGDAIGGGAEIALSCDLIVAAEQARFALPEVKRGLFAAGNGVVRLSRQLPERVANELILTGRFFSAQEALGWGLVNAVEPEGGVLERALSFASAIAEGAPLALEASKRVVLAAADGTPREELERLQGEELDALLATSDAAEGVLAFAEKRAPVWTHS